MTPRSSWLDVPLADYEGHMALPAVGQAGMLADQLFLAIARGAPHSVAVAGCAGGNGFERIGAPVARVVGIDINPSYLEAVRMRHAARIPHLELHCADVASPELRFPPVDLVFAGLIFEYADPAAALATLRRNLRPGGTLAALLQLASGQHPAVSPSPFRSLDTLAGAMRPVAPVDLRRAAERAGFAPEDVRTLGLSSAKRFHLQYFQARP